MSAGGGCTRGPGRGRWGASQVTVAAGAAQAADPGALAALARGRPRRPGAGRAKAEDAQPGLRQALGGVLEQATRGDPVLEVTWCSLSLRDLRRQLAARGFGCGKGRDRADAAPAGLQPAGGGQGPAGAAAPGPGRAGPARPCDDPGVAGGRVPGGQRGRREQGSSPARITATAARGGRPGTRSRSAATTSPARSRARSPPAGLTAPPRSR